MEIVKSRSEGAARKAARIWTQATAKRDAEQVSEADIDKAEDLISGVLASSERSFLATLSNPDDEDELYAFAAFEPESGSHETRAELRYLGTSSEHWGEGWARRLLIALPDPLRESGFSDAVLWVYADNIRAIFVYEAMGWAATGDKRTHRDTGRVESQYRLTLN